MPGYAYHLLVVLKELEKLKFIYCLSGLDAIYLSSRLYEQQRRRQACAFGQIDSTFVIHFLESIMSGLATREI